MPAERVVNEAVLAIFDERLQEIDWMIWVSQFMVFDLISCMGRMRWRLQI